VATTFKLLFDRRQRATHAFGDRDTIQNKSFMLERLSADMGEAEEVKRLAFAPTFSLTFDHTSTAKFYQTSFVRMQFESEFGQSLNQCLMARSSICL